MCDSDDLRMGKKKSSSQTVNDCIAMKFDCDAKCDSMWYEL